MQEAGDVVFVPQGVWHTVLNLEVSVTLCTLLALITAALGKGSDAVNTTGFNYGSFRERE